MNSAAPETGRAEDARGGSYARSRGTLLFIILLVLAAVVLKVVLDLSYAGLMREFFDRDDGSSATVSRLVISYLLVMVAAGAVAMDIAYRPSPGNVPSILYLCFVLVPLLTLYGFDAEFSRIEFIVAAVACSVLVVVLRSILPVIRFPRPTAAARPLIVGLLALLTAYVYGGLIVTGGIGRMNFDLTKVYVVREELELSAFPLSGYVIIWQGYVVNMAALAVGIYRRRYAGIVLVLAAQIFLFGMTNHRSFLLAPLLILGVSFLAASSRRMALGVVLGAMTLLVLGWSLHVITDQIMISSIFVRRLFFVPSELHLWYYDFFSNPANAFVMLSNSVLSWASTYPYEESVALTVGWQYLGNNGSANVGWMAEAYAEFGFAGMFSYSVLMAIALRILDGLATKVPRSVATAVVAIPSMAFVNSGLLTVTLTHGFLPALVLLWAIGGELADDLKHSEA